MSPIRQPARRGTRSAALAVPVLAATIACAASPAAAGADVARIVDTGGGDVTEPTDARVVVAGADGSSRTLGPFRLPERPGSLAASPDGSRLLITSQSFGATAPRLLPTAGGAPVPLRLPAGLRVVAAPSFAGWALDGSSITFGDAFRDGATSPSGGVVATAAVRCDAVTGACAEIAPVGGADPGGLAAGVPGGTIIGSSGLSLLPAEILLVQGSDSETDDRPGLGVESESQWFRDGTRAGRDARAALDRRRVSVLRLDGPAGPRVIGRTTARLADGVPYALQIVGGPSGALVVRATMRTRVQTRGSRFRVIARASTPRLMTVAPDGATRQGAVPVVPVGAADRRRIGLDRREVLRFLPAFGRAGGGWVGTAGSIDGEGGTSTTALATLDDAGRARAVLLGGRAATAEQMLRSAPAGGRTPFSAQFEVVGVERATDSVVVSISSYATEKRFRDGRARTTTMRIPLAGGRPTALPGTADTAW